MFNRLILCPTLIGRALYLTTFHQRLEETSSGHRQIVLLSGEAGIGKSRLAAEIKVSAASQGFQILGGNCFPSDTATPYAPILDLLRTQFIHNPSWSTQIQENDTFRLLSQLLPGIAPLAAAEIPPPHLEPEVHKQRLFTTLISFLASFMAEQPLLLLFEDLHWSDEASLDFLLYLVRWSAMQRLFLLITYRTDENNPALQRWLAQIDRERTAQEFPLTPLTYDDVKDMVQAIFDQPLRADALEDVYRLTEGNPFFVEEVLKSLLLSGDLVSSPKGWGYPAQQRALHIPRSVQEVLRQRTAALNPTSQEVLNTASVIGRRFSFMLLQALTGLDEPMLLTAIKQLIAAQLVTQESVEYFAFRHALTQEAVYSALLARERKPLHRITAEAIERMASGSLSSYRDELVYHYTEAEVWDKALVYARQAGEEAHRMYMPRAAIEQFSRAINAASHLPGLVDASLYQLRGLDYQSIGAFDLAKADHESALQIARSTGNYRDEWQALIDLGALWAAKDYDIAGQYLRKALEVARHLDNPTDLARSLNRLGNWHLNMEQPLEAQQYHSEALVIFEQLRDPHGLAETLDLLGLTTGLTGELGESYSYYQRAIGLFRELDDRRGLCSSLAIGSLLSANYLQDSSAAAALTLKESLRMSEISLEIACQIEWRSGEALALITSGTCLGSMGRYDQALTVLHQALEISDTIQHQQWMTFAMVSLGCVYLDILALPAAQQCLERARSLAMEINSAYWTRLVASFLASVYVQQGDLKRADVTLTNPLDDDAPLHSQAQKTWWSARLELALAQSDHERGSRIAQQLFEAILPQESHARPLWQSAPRLLLWYGQSLFAAKRYHEAEAILNDGLHSAEAQEASPLIWRIRVALGELYRAQRRFDSADDAFFAAAAVIESLAVHIPEEIMRQNFLANALGNIHTSPRRAAKREFGGLTRREREIAALVAQGKSNQEIAGSLILSERTIEKHVSNILNKLGFERRAQIIAWVLEHNLNKP